MARQDRLTERRSIRRRVEDQALRRILNGTADGIVVVDRDGVVCYANPAAGALFGRAPTRLVGGVFGFPLAAGSTEVDVLRRRGGPTVVEMRVVETEWEERPAYLAALRDITDRRRAEEERAERARAEAARAEAEAALASRDAFLAMAAHELNTPLARLTLATQSARRQAARGADAGGETSPDALSLVEREAAHLTRLVRQLLDVARIEAGRFRLRRVATDLRRLVRAAVDAAEPILDGHSLNVLLPPAPVRASVDAAALGEVIADLVTSAVRHTPAGTAIGVELSRDAAGTARLEVCDHGPPVPADVQAALLAPRLPPEPSGYTPGPGVALHLARRIAELHGGRLELSFPVAGGSLAVLHIPRPRLRQPTTRTG